MYFSYIIVILNIFFKIFFHHHRSLFPAILDVSKIIWIICHTWQCRVWGFTELNILYWHLLNKYWPVNSLGFRVCCLIFYNFLFRFINWSGPSNVFFFKNHFLLFSLYLIYRRMLSYYYYYVYICINACMHLHVWICL